MNTLTANRLFGNRPDRHDTHLVTLPLFHSFGQTIDMNAGLSVHAGSRRSCRGWRYQRGHARFARATSAPETVETAAPEPRTLSGVSGRIRRLFRRWSQRWGGDSGGLDNR